MTGAFAYPAPDSHRRADGGKSHMVDYGGGVWERLRKITPTRASQSFDQGFPGSHDAHTHV
jgi:hypothetical protein